MEQFSRRALGVSALYGLLSILFCLPLFARPFGLGAAGWDRQLFYYSEVLKNVVEYRQAPFWSPWQCGGNVMWQHPSVPLLSPVYLLVAIMPLALAVKVNVVLHYWIGLLGMHWLLTRAVRLTSLPLVVYAASIFTLSGSLALHVAAGDSDFLPAFYLPWLLYFLHLAFQSGRLRPALAAAAILAVTIYSGGVPVVPIALVTIAGLAVATAIATRDWRPLAFALVVGTYAAAYAAPKLLPVAEFVASDRSSDTRTPIDHPDRMTGDMAWRAYTDPTLGLDARVSSVQRHKWAEYGNYIGILGAIAIGVSLLWPLIARTMPERSRAAAIAVLATSCLILSVGEFHPFSPASGLAAVTSFGGWSRYTIAVVLFGALAIGAAGRHAIDRWLTTPRRQYALAVVCAIGVANLVFVNQRQFANAASQPPLAAGIRVLEPSAQPCNEPLQLIRGADVARPLLWSEDSATISDIVFTPNRVQFAAVGGFAPSKIFLNQNYAPGWRSSAGPVLLDAASGGKMYVQLAAGQTGTFAFSFAPPALTSGVMLFVVALVASALAWNLALAPVIADRSSAREVAVATRSFADLAEQASKGLILISLAAAIAVRALIADNNQAGFAAIAAASFAAAWAASALWENAAGLLLGATFVAPAVFSRFWVHDPNAYPLFLTTGLLGAMWRRGSWRHWSLPKDWRVPLVGWALAAAVSWPIIALRELDFHPELPGMLDLPASAIALSVRSSIAIAADATALLMLGILWLDWLFQHYSGDRRRFQRSLIVPLLAGGAIACAVAAYQLFGDITFLNAGWAQFHRTAATMMDANGFGIAAMLFGCGFLASFDRGGDRRWNVLMLGGFALSLVGTWASGSKTALVAQMVALAFAAESLARPSGSSSRTRRSGRLAALAVACVTAGVLLFALRGTGPALRIGWILPGASFDSIAGFSRMLWDRGGYGRAAVEMIRAHTWFGVGLGSFPLIVGDYQFSHLGGPLAPDNAQNWIRHNLAELGVIGSLGWIAWAVCLAIALFRRPNRARDRSTAVVAGALVGIVLVSQVGMPTQNAAVAMAFWTFLFWYFSDRWPATPNGERQSVASWQWIVLAAAVVVFAIGTFHTSLTSLRVPMRARQGGWNYVYGFHEIERTPGGDAYRPTDQHAVAVVRASSPVVKLAVWVTRPDVAMHPVLARVWHDDRLVLETVLRDNQPVTTDVIIDRDPQMLMVRTYLDRTVPASRPDLGLAVEWTFVDTSQTAHGQPVR